MKPETYDDSDCESNEPHIANCCCHECVADRRVAHVKNLMDELLVNHTEEGESYE